MVRRRNGPLKRSHDSPFRPGSLEEVCGFLSGGLVRMRGGIGGRGWLGVGWRPRYPHPPSRESRIAGSPPLSNPPRDQGTGYLGASTIRTLSPNSSCRAP
jgi:hypothetical protein